MIAIISVMLTVASLVARNRISQKIPRLLPLVWGSIFNQYNFKVSAIQIYWLLNLRVGMNLNI